MTHGFRVISAGTGMVIGVKSAESERYFRHKHKRCIDLIVTGSRYENGQRTTSHVQTPNATGILSHQQVMSSEAAPAQNFIDVNGHAFPR